MNSIEALEQIMEKYIFYVPARSEGKEHLLNCLNIIAKDLERLKQLEEENEKLKQAIEILKDKIKVYGVMHEYYQNEDYYINLKNINQIKLNDKEYEILKEVLGNE